MHVWLYTVHALLVDYKNTLMRKSHSTSVTHEHTYRIKPCVCKQISRQYDVFPIYLSYFFEKGPILSINQVFIKLQLSLYC